MKTKLAEEVDILGKLLGLRIYFKELMQLTWTVNAIEKRYPDFQGWSRDDITVLYQTYLSMTQRAIDTLEGLKKEYEKNENGR